MPRPKVNDSHRRKTVTFTMTTEDIQRLKEYALHLSMSAGVPIAKGQIIESVIKDFLYSKKAAE